MSFSQDKARMKLLLQTHKAPSEVISDFDDICRYRTKETAEELLRDICIRHGFAAPYMRDGQAIFIRPHNLGAKHLGHQDDCMGTDPATEQGYRRGYDQGVAHVLEMLAAGRPVNEIKAYSKQVHEWRVQPIQAFRSLPGTDNAVALTEAITL